jgi:hypothetical protein
VTRPSETQMHEQPNSSDHVRHDLLAVAALADRDAIGEEAVRAQAQVDACTECAALHAEIVSLATATRQLPPVERPRDFQLRPEDAQRLRPNRIRRLFGSFGTARDGFSRPLAMGLTTLGIAGLMLGILPGTLSFGGATSGGPAATNAPAAPAMDQPLDAAASAPAAGGAPEQAQPSIDLQQEFDGSRAMANPAPLAGELEGEGFDQVAGPVAIAGERESLTSIADDSSGASQLVVISGTLLIVGLGLFGLRWTSRRFGG